MDSDGCAIGVLGEIYSRRGTGVLKKILEDIKQEGYKVQVFIIPACAVQAWHRRDRVWIVADSTKNDNHGDTGEFQEKNEQVRKKGQIQGDAKSDSSDNRTANPNNRKERTKRREFQAIPKLRGLQRGEDGRIYANIEGRRDLSTPVLCGSYDGIPGGMDRVAACGNAIVPQVAFQIFKAIENASTLAQE